MGMYRELTISVRFTLILSIFILGSTGCGLKFGSEARQASENTNKNKSSSKFVEVDNTKSEPKVMAAKSPAANESKPANTAEYVRMGKERRIKYKHPDDSSASMAKSSESQPTSPIALVKGAHQNIKNAVRATHEKIMTKLGRRNSEPEKVLYPTVQLFGAGLRQSQWLISSKDIECFITHPIPRLGRAKFNYNPVQKLRFIFEVDHPPARNLEIKDKRYERALMTDIYPYPEVGAKLESIPPDWKPFATKKMLGYIPFKKGFQPFILPHHQRLFAEELTMNTKHSAQKNQVRQTQVQVASITNDYLPEIWPDRLMDELEEGMLIRLTYRDWVDGTQDIISTISPINFIKMKVKFESCISKLPKYDFNKFKETRLHFTKKQHSLSKKMRRKLEQMVKFIKLDDTIKKVMIKSYTDSMGFKRVNKIDAKAQAQAIKSYMKKLGMSVPITAIGIGEGPFVASNRSSAGRAKNRRSVITLIK